MSQLGGPHRIPPEAADGMHIHIKNTVRLISAMSLKHNNTIHPPAVERFRKPDFAEVSSLDIFTLTNSCLNQTGKQEVSPGDNVSHLQKGLFCVSKCV